MSVLRSCWPAANRQAHYAEIMLIPPPTKPMTRSAAAERMRLHRERRRQGLRCVTIELRETEIDALIRRGLLKAETRNDPIAICEALYRHLDRSLAGTHWGSRTQSM